MRLRGGPTRRAWWLQRTPRSPWGSLRAPSTRGRRGWCARPSRPPASRASVLPAPSSPTSGHPIKLCPRPGTLSSPTKLLLILPGNLPRPSTRLWAVSAPSSGFPGAPQPEGSAAPAGARSFSSLPRGLQGPAGAAQGSGDQAPNELEHLPEQRRRRQVDKPPPTRAHTPSQGWVFGMEKTAGPRADAGSLFLAPRRPLEAGVPIRQVPGSARPTSDLRASGAS